MGIPLIFWPQMYIKRVNAVPRGSVWSKIAVKEVGGTPTFPNIAAAPPSPPVQCNTCKLRRNMILGKHVMRIFDSQGFA